jgi:hypothetical protein
MKMFGNRDADGSIILKCVVNKRAVKIEIIIRGIRISMNTSGCTLGNI